MPSTGSDAGREPVTFPQYLLLNAKRFADRTATRHKDLGIWQSWTWKQQYEEIRAFSIGLQEMGVGEGDKVAIAGTNRPRLYWTFCAVQALKAIPVPVYADAVADGLFDGAKNGFRFHDHPAPSAIRRIVCHAVLIRRVVPYIMSVDG